MTEELLLIITIGFFVGSYVSIYDPFFGFIKSFFFLVINFAGIPFVIDGILGIGHIIVHGFRRNVGFLADITFLC